MADLNNCAFVGHLETDATTEAVGAKGTLLTKFSFSNTTGFGQYVKTNHFDAQIWGKQGEALKPYLVKGKPVALVGTLECNKWVGRDGVERFSWVLTCNSVTLLNGGTPVDEKPTEYKEEVAW